MSIWYLSMITWRIWDIDKNRRNVLLKIETIAMINVVIAITKKCIP